MNVEIEIIPCGNPVIKDPRLKNILRRYRVKPLEMAGFTHADIRCGSHQITILVSGRVFTQERNHFIHLPAADFLGFRQLADIGRVDVDDIRHVDADFAGNTCPVEQYVSGGMRQNGLAECLNLSFRHIDIGLETAGKDRSGVINAADAEHQRDRLAEMIAFASEFIFRTRARRDIAVAGGVDHDFRHDCLAPGFAFRDDPRDAVAVHDHIGNLSVKLNLYPRFVHHLKQGALETLMADAPTVALIRILRQGRAFAGAVHDLVEKRRGRAAAPVRHHAAGRHSAKRVGLFHDHDFRSGARRTESRSDSGGASACNQDFRFRSNGNGSCRFRIRFHIISFFTVKRPASPFLSINYTIKKEKSLEFSKKNS